MDGRRADMVKLINAFRNANASNNNNNNNNNIHTDRCDNTRRQKCCAKGSGEEEKIREFMYRGTTNVEPEIYDYTSNNWSHWNSDEKLKKKFGSCTRKICGLGSVVGITTDYGLDGLESNPGGDEIFRPSRPALGLTQPPVKWVPVLSRG
jgi:hypothetical protein